jgi:phosphoribosylanthranilate isomerase
MTVRVKICGVRTPEQALAAAEAGADFIGLMFAESSRRKVDPSEAYDIVHVLGTPLGDIEQDAPPAAFRTPSSASGQATATDVRAWYEHGAAALERLLARKRPLTVGVFANNDPEQVNELVDECGIDLIQLSGGEPWGHCLLAARQVIKVVHVGDADDAASTLARFETGSAMAIMLDKAVGGALGGTGKAFDWRVAAAVASQTPVWLAGGLSPENVASAVQTVRPWAVDVSSGVETDGVKDVAKIVAFVKAAKS